MIKIFRNIFVFITFLNLSLGHHGCRTSITTASGTTVTNGHRYCVGQKIFEDNFDTLDSNKWEHENTLAGGGNWEFQWYTNDRKNSFVRDGKLHIRPSLTSDIYGESFLSSGTIDLNKEPGDRCTWSDFWGCQRTGNPTNILNPIRSARLRTKNSFNFKYGRVVIRAKLPAGDWLWPAMWLLPKSDFYGGWPSSGEIDIMEGRGNKNLRQNGVNIGTEQVGSTLHFGPNPQSNGFNYAHFEKNSSPGQGFDKDFHNYEIIWTPHHIKFKLDGSEIGTVRAGEGFFKKGHFSTDIENPWKRGTKMAPFDQEFHLILNLAVGGVNGYFPDGAENPTPKPWPNNSPHAATDFWNGRSSWLPTWNLNDENNVDSALIVDYVHVYAL